MMDDQGCDQDIVHESKEMIINVPNHLELN